MRIGFVGRSDLTFDSTFLKELATEYPYAEWLHGGARGFDDLVERIASTNKIKTRVFLPNYKQYPAKIAPLRRNLQMLEELVGGGFLVAGYDGRKKGGTRYTITQAYNRNIPVIIIPPQVKVHLRDTLLQYGLENLYALANV